MRHHSNVSLALDFNWLISYHRKVIYDSRALAQAQSVLDQAFYHNVDSAAAFDGLVGSFDVILFLDVIEHCRHPQAILGAARRLLTPAGRIITSLPNIANWTIRRDLLLGRFDYQPVGILDETHVRFYTAKTMRNLFT